LTGFDGLRSKAEAAGFNIYLVKPFDLAALSQALQRLGLMVGEPATFGEYRRVA
jgi:hypothetical protein